MNKYDSVIGLIESDNNVLSVQSITKTTAFELKIQVPGIVSMKKIPSFMRHSEEQNLRVKLAYIDKAMRLAMERHLNRRVFPVVGDSFYEKHRQNGAIVLGLYLYKTSECGLVIESLLNVSQKLQERKDVIVWVDKSHPKP